jgi:hypothetical protein
VASQKNMQRPGPSVSQAGDGLVCHDCSLRLDVTRTRV